MNWGFQILVDVEVVRNDYLGLAFLNLVLRKANVCSDVSGRSSIPLGKLPVLGCIFHVAIRQEHIESPR